jgi:thiamine pyrophosphate-dependent acetolactate synthase large subunit-like protein
MTWPDFDAAIAAALTAERPTVIEVPVDPADYDQML